MGKVYLRRRNTVKGLKIHEGKSFTVKLADGSNGFLEIRKPLDTEISKNIKSEDAIFVICGEYDPNSKTSLVFNAFIDGKRNPQGKKANSAEELVIRDGPDNMLSFQPNSYAEYIRAVIKDFSIIQLNAAKSIRWRYFRKGPVDVLKQGRIEASINNQQWAYLPDMDVTCEAYVIKSTSLDFSILEQSEFDDIKLLNEPLHHELLRESLELISNSPRSSLILAISAIEVAVKTVILHFTSNSEWLINNSQSPDVVKIIREYFPILIDNYDSCAMDRDLVESIRDGIFARNNIIHSGKAPPKVKSIQKIILASYKLAWFCDYYCGNEWALEYARDNIEFMDLKH